MLKRGLTLIVGLVTGGCLVYLWLAVAATSATQPTALAAEQASVIQDAAASPPVIQYQGRLLDPATGQPKADGGYQMTFSLYDVNTGGAPLWTETKSVSVSKGLFATLLGDTNALNLAAFDGRDLFLGVSVGGDPEATPRQRIAHVAYAIRAENADKLDGQDASAFALASHAHDGSTITSGVVAETFIDPAVARDSEIVPTVQASGNFAAAVHTHTGADLQDGTIGTADLANGAVTYEKLAPGVAPKFLSLDPMAALLTGSGTFASGFGPNAGMHLPDGASPSFYLGFTIPPDYTTGTTLVARFLWHTSAVSCGIEFRGNAISVARPGRTHIIGVTTDDGLTVVGGETLNAPGASNQTKETFVNITSPDGVTALLAGDSVIFSLYRFGAGAADTCAADMVIQSVSITYQ